MIFGVVVAQAQRLRVRFAHGFLGRKLLIEKLLHHAHVHVQQRHQRARVRDVLHQNPLARFLERLIAHLRERHGQIVHVFANEMWIQRPSGIVEQIAALANFRHVLRVSLRIHRHHQIVIERPRRVPVLIDADLVPGRQALNVRREKILAGYRNPHAEDRLHQQAVGAGRSGAVHVR